LIRAKSVDKEALSHSKGGADDANGKQGGGGDSTCTTCLYQFTHYTGAVTPALMQKKKKKILVAPDSQSGTTIRYLAFSLRKKEIHTSQKCAPVLTWSVRLCRWCHATQSAEQ